MAITFKNLRSPLLDLQDKIMIGKLAGCRVCDVTQDHYEYLIWADKTGLMKFTKLVLESIAEHAQFEARETHYREEVAPFIEPQKERDYTEIDLDDIPF